MQTLTICNCGACASEGESRGAASENALGLSGHGYTGRSFAERTSPSRQTPQDMSSRTADPQNLTDRIAELMRERLILGEWAPG